MFVLHFRCMLICWFILSFRVWCYWEAMWSEFVALVGFLTGATSPFRQQSEWMDGDLRFHVRFNSISVISGR